MLYIYIKPRNASSVFPFQTVPEVSEPVEPVAAPALATNSFDSQSGAESGGGTGRSSSGGLSNECFFSFSKALCNEAPHNATGSITTSQGVYKCLLTLGRSFNDL